jgi:hypothetical protein
MDNGLLLCSSSTDLYSVGAGILFPTLCFFCYIFYPYRRKNAHHHHHRRRRRRRRRRELRWLKLNSALINTVYYAAFSILSSGVQIALSQ